MKNKFLDKRNIAFREKQRQQSLQSRVHVRKKAEEKLIEVKPFNGVGCIEPVDLSAYRYLTYLIGDVIHPNKNLEKPVSCLMVNMLLGLGTNVFEPGKYYSSQERKYTKEQLRVFRDSLSALEINFGKDKISGNTGRFERKDSYHFSDVGEFVFSELWKGEGRYDIVYVRNPSWMVFDKDYVRMNMGDIAEEKYKEEVDRLRKLAYDLEEGGFEYVAKKIGLKIEEMKKDEEEFFKEFCRKCRQYLDENKDIDETLKGDLEKFIEIGDIILKIGQNIDEEAKKVSDEKTIVTGMSQNIGDNGVLILESSKVKDIEGLRLVDSYDDVRLYQRI